MKDDFSSKAIRNNYINFFNELSHMSQQNEKFEGNPQIKVDYNIKSLEGLVELIESACVKEGGNYNSSYKDMKSACEDSYITTSIADVANYIEFVNSYSQQWIEDNRGFGDIIGSVRNMAEAKLVNTALSLLEPHELSNAIQDNLHPKDMENKMENSRVNKMIRRVLSSHQQMLNIVDSIEKERSNEVHHVKDLEREKKQVSLVSRGLE